MGTLSDAPDFFSESQKEIWQYAIKHAPKGLLKKLDREALGVWAIARDMWQQAVVALGTQDKGKAFPLLVDTPNGFTIQSPYLGIISKQSQIMLKAGSDLGFSPSARSRITIEPNAAENETLESILAS